VLALWAWVLAICAACGQPKSHAEVPVRYQERDARCPTTTSQAMDLEHAYPCAIVIDDNGTRFVILDPDRVSVQPATTNWCLDPAADRVSAEPDQWVAAIGPIFQAGAVHACASRQ
jgi:CO dehydrogenase/acetyl-CoA synthase beta subunit